MNKLILLITVLFLNACAQQNIRTNNQQSAPISEKPKVIETSPETIEHKESISIEPLILTEPDVTKIPVVQKLSVIKPQEQAKTVEKPKTVDLGSEIKVVNDNIKHTEKIKAKALPHNISGHISLNYDAIKDKEAEIKSTIVYFQVDGYKSTQHDEKNHVIASQNKRFVPNVLAIQKGSTVTFPNMDRILHNVFSVSNIQSFDLGLYSAGKEKTVVFDKAGIIYVHCNVHHSMQADILVLETPFYTSVDEKGNFSLNNLPNKSGNLYIWHPRAKLQKIAIDDDNNHIEETVNIVRKKIPRHMNKFGTPYRPKRKNK